MGYPGNRTKRWVPSASPVQPRRQVTFEESSSDSNTKATAKMVDWSQPVKVDDSLPPSMAPKTADWSQPKEGDLKGPPVLDPQVEEFLSGKRPEDDPDLWDCLPEPSFDNGNEWVAWQAD